MMPTKKPFAKMTTTELGIATRQFDEEFVPTRALTASDKTRHRQARATAKRGRPQVGKGAKRVLVTIERGLLKEADAFGKLHKLKRAEMVSQALRLLIRAS